MTYRPIQLTNNTLSQMDITYKVRVASREPDGTYMFLLERKHPKPRYKKRLLAIYRREVDE